MSADLRIMEGVIQSEVDSHNGRSERATQKAQDLPIKVDAGVATDIITDILKEADQPLHRDEIIKRVLDKRQVKETTILLNLQSKSQFKRVAKATYVFEQQQA